MHGHIRVAEALVRGMMQEDARDGGTRLAALWAARNKDGNTAADAARKAGGGADLQAELKLRGVDMALLAQQGGASTGGEQRAADDEPAAKRLRSALSLP
jgi:hypothetical protein